MSISNGDKRQTTRQSLLDNSVLQERCTNSVMVDRGVGRSFGTVCSTIFEFPSILSLVMEQPRVVVTLVKVFKDRGQDLWLFFRQIDAFSVRLKELASAGCLEEG